MEISLPDMQSGYVRLVEIVRTHGASVVVRGLPTRELIGTTLIFQPYQQMLPIGVGRGVNTALAALEAASMIAGVVRPELIKAVAPTYTSVLVDATDMESAAYGPRARSALGFVYDELRSDPTSRRAVVSIWRPNDAEPTFGGGDRPCTLSLQFLLRDRRLNLIVTMRSQDVWLGAAMDMFLFAQVRDTMANALGVAPGRYAHNVGSLHIYERDVERSFSLHLPATRDLLKVRHADGVLPTDREQFVESGWAACRRTARRLVDAGYGDRDLDDSLNGWYVDRMTDVARRYVAVTSEENGT